MSRTNNVAVLLWKMWALHCFIMALLFTFMQATRLEFTTEPNDIVVYPESSAVLNCNAQLVDRDLRESLSSDNISWKAEDGQTILYPGETYRSKLKNGSLYFSSVIDHQGLTGNYRCVATLENIGSIVSRSANVRLASLSGFIQEPRDNTLYPGQTAYFTCLVNADPLATIQWLKDERPFILDESRMLILPSGALEIDDVQPSDQGTYRCNASAFNNYRLSNKAVLALRDDLDLSAIMSGPSFISRPRDIIAMEGETVTLDCAAIGNPKPWITWLKNGVTIDMAHLDSRFQKIGTGSLQISNVIESDSGSYQCRADNTEDSDDATAELNVHVPPKFIKKPQDIKEVAKKDIEFECEIYGKPEPTIQWLKNGEVIKYNDYMQLVNGYNLRILGLLMIDAGIFQCIGSNAAGNIQASAVLTIIDQSMTTQASKAKKATRFPRNKLSKSHAHKVLASLAPAEESGSHRKKYSRHEYSDYFNSEGASPSDDDDEDDDDDDEDTLGETSFGYARKEFEFNPRNVEFDPANIFTMLKSDNNHNSNNRDDVDEGLGETHFAFTESPPFPPSFPNNLGESSVLSNRESGLPSEPQDLVAVIVRPRFVTLSWKAPAVTHGEIISYSVGYKQEGSNRERTQLTKKPRLEEISIQSLNPDRKYLFRVTAYNQKGAGRPSEYLEVQTKSEENVPSSPKNIKAFATSSKSIKVSWDEPDIKKGVIQRYKVYYMEGNTEHSVDTSNLEYELTELLVYTEYSIWVVGINQNGPGAATNEVVVRTLSAAPTAPPNNITADVSSSTSVTIRWEPPLPEHWNGIITGYKIRYRKPRPVSSGGSAGGGGGAGVKTYSTDANIRMSTLNNLDRASTYQVKVQAFNVNGTGPWSEWLNIETYENDLDESQVPAEPSPLRARPMAKSIIVMWNPPKNSNIKVRGYTLGWGKGIPDIYTETLDGKQRFYEIKNLEPDSEYVISLRARNEVGDGPPVYTVVRTKLESDEIFSPPPVEQIPPLLPPVGLKAIVLTASTVVLYWTDSTLSKSQYVTDNRYYTVKYSAVANRKERFFNASDLNCMIDDLKPNTLYEFSVKVVKGRRESDWSMVVSNTTFESAPTSSPRDLQVIPFENNPHMALLNWQPPKQSNGIITGYLIQYTTDMNKKDRDWIVEGVVGDKNQTVIQNLDASMTYYFKILARNTKGYGPYSQIVSFTTGMSNGMPPYDSGYLGKDSRGPFNGLIIYVAIGITVVFVTGAAIILIVVCCRKRSDPNLTPDRSKKGYQKAQKNQNIKPPDLWIHHDQMELKAMEKSSHGCTNVSGGAGSNDGASSSGATTLPRSMGHEYDSHDCHGLASNSLDKRTYIPSYMGNKSDENRRAVKPKPIMLPVDPKPLKEPIATATPINNPSNPMLHQPTDSPSAASTIVTPSGLLTSRPSYPRTQYTISRAHVTIDQNALENPYAIQPNSSIGGGYDTGLGLSSASTNYASLPSQSSQSSILNNPSAGVVKTQQITGPQGHPLKSFSVPAPPPNSAPGTPAHQSRQHNVTQVSVRPITSSPYKKMPTSLSSMNSTPHLRSNPLSTIASATCEESRPLYVHHEGEILNRSLLGPSEDCRLLPNSTSTEELNQEMANLEGLMKDLNAITASEFEC